MYSDINLLYVYVLLLFGFIYIYILYCIVIWSVRWVIII